MPPGLGYKRTISAITFVHDSAHRSSNESLNKHTTSARDGGLESKRFKRALLPIWKALLLSLATLRIGWALFLLRY